MFKPQLHTEEQLAALYFIIEPSRFHFLKFILEGYDNLAILSSINRKDGVVRIKTSRDSIPELMVLISDLANRIQKSTI